MSKVNSILSTSPYVRGALEHLVQGRFPQGLEEWRKAMTDRGFCYENCEQFGKNMDDQSCSACCEGLLLTLALYSGQSSENEYVDLLERLRLWASNSNEEGVKAD